MFIMGSFGSNTGPGNFWTSLDDFPNPAPKSLFLASDGALRETAQHDKDSATYMYDPRDPAPMIGGNNLPAIGSIEYCGSADQLPRDGRQDVLVFESLPIEADMPVVGPVSAKVYVSSTAQDTDFFVTVSDMHPDNSKSMLVRYGMQRMRWRESEVTKSSPMIKDEVYEVTINMGYTGYIFPKGHKVRVTVSSAAAPYYVPTTNTGSNDMVEEVDPIIAENTVHFSLDFPSQVLLPVVTLENIPPNSHFTAIGPFADSSQEEAIV